MNSPRVIANILLKDDLVVQSYKFNKYYPIGNLNKSLEYLNEWGIDEIFIININSDKKINYDLLNSCLKNYNLPICYGGGVSNINQIKKLLKIGIDKVSFNNLLTSNKYKLKEISSYLGSQFVVGSIDLLSKNKNFFAYNHKKQQILNRNVLEIVKEYENNGVGEFHLNFIDRDGVGKGMEINFVKKIKKVIKSPIIVSGGASNSYHLVDFYKRTGCTPCISNFFNHIENPVSYIKSEYFKFFKEVRKDKFSPYNKSKIDKILFRNENR